MSLRAQARQDAVSFLENTSEFGWPVTVTDPDGLTLALTGFHTDIGQTIDPDTGQAVAGRLASIALPICRFTDAQMDVPRGIEDSASKPWVIQVTDIVGGTHVFKVSEALPDKAIGVVVCFLETYRV